MTNWNVSSNPYAFGFGNSGTLPYSTPAVDQIPAGQSLTLSGVTTPSFSGQPPVDTFEHSGGGGIGLMPALTIGGAGAGASYLWGDKVGLNLAVGKDGKVAQWAINAADNYNYNTAYQAAQTALHDGAIKTATGGQVQNFAQWKALQEFANQPSGTAVPDALKGVVNTHEEAQQLFKQYDGKIQAPTPAAITAEMGKNGTQTLRSLNTTISNLKGQKDFLSVLGDNPNQVDMERYQKIFGEGAKFDANAVSTRLKAIDAEIGRAEKSIQMVTGSIEKQVRGIAPEGKIVLQENSNGLANALHGASKTNALKTAGKVGAAIGAGILALRWAMGGSDNKC